MKGYTYIFKFLLKCDIHSEKCICSNAQFGKFLLTECMYINSTQNKKQHDQPSDPLPATICPKDNHNLDFWESK